MPPGALPADRKTISPTPHMQSRQPGIVEGYFSNGTSTYKGGNNLTRGHISAIVWRMERYQG